MKAYEVWNLALDFHQTIVFAENYQQAKVIAFRSDLFDGYSYMAVRVKRMKEADRLYKGHPEIDWDDQETRKALVRDFGWTCEDRDWYCDGCESKAFCPLWEDDLYDGLEEEDDENCNGEQPNIEKMEN